MEKKDSFVTVTAREMHPPGARVGLSETSFIMRSHVKLCSRFDHNFYNGLLFLILKLSLFNSQV